GLDMRALVRPAVQMVVREDLAVDLISIEQGPDQRLVREAAGPGQGMSPARRVLRPGGTAPAVPPGDLVHLGVVLRGCFERRSPLVRTADRSSNDRWIRRAAPPNFR